MILVIMAIAITREKLKYLGIHGHNYESPWLGDRQRQVWFSLGKNMYSTLVVIDYYKCHSATTQCCQLFSEPGFEILIIRY